MLHTAICDPDPSTIACARAGESRAFTRLVEIYQTPIYNLCYRLLGNPHDAEEATQEIYVRVYTKMASYDPARSFKTWLFSIAHHYCIDRLRRRRAITLSLDDELAPEAAVWCSPTPSPEETALRRERESSVQALLNTLPAQDRSALIMRYWFDLSYEEIARTTGATVSAVKSRLHRARGALAGRVGAAEQDRPSLSRPLGPAMAEAPQAAA